MSEKLLEGDKKRELAGHDQHVIFRIKIREGIEDQTLCSRRSRARSRVPKSAIKLHTR